MYNIPVIVRIHCSLKGSIDQDNFKMQLIFTTVVSSGIIGNLVYVPKLLI